MNSRTSWNQSTWNKSDASLWLCNMGRNGHNGEYVGKLEKDFFFWLFVLTKIPWVWTPDLIWWWNLTIWAMFDQSIPYDPYTCMLSPALYLYIYLSCLVNGNLCDGVCNIKKGPFHSMWSHCFMYFQIVAWNHVFSRVSIILCAFRFFISAHILSFKVLPLEGSRWTNNSGHGSSSGTPFPLFRKRISNYAFGRYISVLSNLNALYLGFLLCTFMSLSCSAVK